MSKTSVVVLARNRAWRAAHPEQVRMFQNRYYTRRKSLLDEIKLSRGCVDCGYNVAPEALCFDHRDPKFKSFTLSQRRTSLAETLLEVAKCDVRCTNCHAIRTKRLGHTQTRRDT